MYLPNKKKFMYLPKKKKLYVLASAKEHKNRHLSYETWTRNTAITLGMHWRIYLIQLGYILWIVLPGIDIVNFVPGLNPNFYPLSMLVQQIIQLDLSYCWAFGIKWSPSGNTLAYVGEKFLLLISWRTLLTSACCLKEENLPALLISGWDKFLVVVMESSRHH